MIYQNNHCFRFTDFIALKIMAAQGNNENSANFKGEAGFGAYIRWDEEMKLALAKSACIHKAYIPTIEKNALKMEDKWKNVIRDLALDPLFAGTGLASKSWESVYSQFRRFKDEVLKISGVSDESVNLSGFSEEPTEYITLMMNMAEKIANKAIGKY